MMAINILMVILIGIVGAGVVVGAVLLLDSICDADKREERHLKHIAKSLPPCRCGCKPKFIMRRGNFYHAKYYKLYCDGCQVETRYLETPELTIKDWKHFLELRAGDNVKIDEDYTYFDEGGVVVAHNFAEFFLVKIKSVEYSLPYYALIKLKTSAKVV